MTFFIYETHILEAYLFNSNIIQQALAVCKAQSYVCFQWVNIFYFLRFVGGLARGLPPERVLRSA